jgi:photosystem II stability/assembly factor-like uncharacterized protein
VDRIVIMRPGVRRWCRKFLNLSRQRPFFVRRADIGNNDAIRSVYFADAHTGRAVGLGGTILATRDGGSRLSGGH